MPRDKEQMPKGLQKEHEVTYPDGTTGTMTQQEWKDRDKSLGIERVDEDDSAEEPVDEELPV